MKHDDYHTLTSQLQESQEKDNVKFGIKESTNLPLLFQDFSNGAMCSSNTKILKLIARIKYLIYL